MKKNVEQDSQYVAELDADATREKLAEIYATGLLGACDSAGASFEEVREDYESFISQICDVFPSFEKILQAPNVSAEEKQRIIDEVCSNTNPLFKNYLKTLVRRNRVDMLRDVLVACRRLYDEKKGRIPVNVTTAEPLSEATRSNLLAELKSLLGGEPTLQERVDHNVIGGIVVRVGDVVYDASIATQLDKVRQEMISRSAHEIQNRRDRFRNPEGN